MFEKRIAKGMAWLDKNRPGWVKKIKHTQLRMVSPTYCVIGQTFGNFFDVINERTITEEYAKTLGFTLSGSAPNKKWDTLTREWQEAIKQRKAQQQGGAKCLRTASSKA